MKAIYTPMSGALAQERVLEIIANNLANANTTGFKGDQVTFKLLEPEPNKHYKSPLPPANYKVSLDDVMPTRGNELAYVGVAGVERDTSQGPAIQTGNPLDIMIEGEGMLAVNTKDGLRYTRAGHLSLNGDGILVTERGDPILGDKGVISLKSSALEINRRGEIYQNGQLIDKLQIYKFKSDKDLERVGDNSYFFGGPAEAREQVKDPSVSQGYLEGSNVNAIKNITSMIIAHRSYEAYQKTVQNYDRMMDRSSNELGQVRA
jgi:flagellar basal-body rod protein FlgG